MDQLPTTVTISTVLLTAFLIFICTLTYAVTDKFLRTRLMMTSFFLFIVATLTISFWQYTLQTLPYTIPACAAGMVLGYTLGVRAAKERMNAEGVVHYMEHFAHIHPTHIKNLTWWSLINFYSVMGALVLINLVGFSTVIYRDAVGLVIATSAIGAFLLGTIVPYLFHIWSIKAPHATTITTSDK